MNIPKLIECENNFPGSFTNVIEKPYGKLFYNPENPESHDSNHAVILDYAGDMKQALDDIICFYESLSLTPRIYQSYQTSELEILTPLLQEKGFQIGTWYSPFLFHLQESIVTPNPELKIRRVAKVEDGIIEVLRSEDEDDIWTVKVLQRHFKTPGFHYFVGYLGSKIVATASVEFLNGFSRVDNVITHREYRGRRYGRTMLHHLVNVHKVSPDNQLYLFSVSPTATRMYQDAGFVEINLNLKNWSAWRE